MNEDALKILRKKLIGKKILLAFPHLKQGNEVYYEIHNGDVTDINYYEKGERLDVTLDNTRCYGVTHNEGGYKFFKDYDYTDHAKNYINFFTGEAFDLIRL